MLSLRREQQYVGLAVFLVVGGLLARYSSWQGGPVLHTIMETVATVLALLVGIQALLRYYARPQPLFLFIGCGFLGTGLLDGYHALVTSPIFPRIMPSSPRSLMPWSWVASRIFLAVFLFFAWLGCWVQERGRFYSRWMTPRWVYAGSAVFLIGCFVFFLTVPLPRAYYPELLFGRPQEFVPAYFFLLGLVGFWHRRCWRDDAFEHWLMMALIVSFFSQSVFMSFSVENFDGEFDAAHLLKKLSYICVLTGLFISTFALYKEVETQARSLEEVNRRLERETRRKEKTLRQLKRTSQALEYSNRELEQFAYVASHDLQEPVRKIVGFTQLLEKECGEALSTDARRYIGYVVDGARRLQHLIQDLLQYSRAGSLELKKEEVDFAAIVNEACANLSAVIAERQAVIERDGLPGVKGHPSFLVRVVQNLLGNAIKFCEETPRVRISARRVNNEFVFSFEDNGIGIEPEYRDKVFKVFQRLHGRDAYPGTGIGLSICRRIIERHGGRMWIENRSDGRRGTVFVFTLPVG